MIGISHFILSASLIDFVVAAVVAAVVVIFFFFFKFRLRLRFSKFKCFFLGRFGRLSI